MICLGLIGYPLSHSLSPRLHAAAFKALRMEGEYRLYPVAPENAAGLAQLTERIRKGELQGLNITIPHKQSILPLLDELTTSAEGIGAVNTVSLKKNKLVGQNTDAPGFLADLRRCVPDGFSEKKAIVLGAGGAARAIVYALLTDHWSVTLAVRKADVSQASTLIASMKYVSDGKAINSVYMEVEGLSPLVDDVSLLVNATPVGMFPEVGNSPWPEGLAFPRRAVAYDLVYNPHQTLFLQQARTAGLSVASGIGMLVEQAALSFEIWTGREPPRDLMLAQVEEK